MLGVGGRRKAPHRDIGQGCGLWWWDQVGLSIFSECQLCPRQVLPGPAYPAMELHWVLLLSPSGASEASLPPSSGPSPPFRGPHPAPCSPRPLPHCRGTTTVDGAGFGIDRPAELSKEDDEYEAFRKRMMLAYRFRPNPLMRVSPSPSCFCWVTTVPPLEGWWCW